MEQGPARRPALPTVSIAAAGAAAVSLAVVAVPWLRMTVEAPSLRVALETGGALLAVMTVVLLLRQCGLRSRADHLWLTAGLVTLALTSLTAATLIVAGAWSPTEARYAMGGTLAGTVMLAVAAFAPSTKLSRSPRAVLLPAAALGLVVFGLASLLVGTGPTRLFDPKTGRIIIQVATAAALMLAAVGLTRRDEPLLRCVAAAVLLAAVAKLDYALFPPVGPENVHLGDILRVTAWALLFGGVVRELRVRAVAVERRRMARELHDGIAQELALIRRRASGIVDQPDGPAITAAAERALGDLRSVIEALVPPAHEPLDVALQRLGAALASECRITVQVNVRDDVDASAEVRAELLPIIAEAVRNAARHGGAKQVRVDIAGSPLSVRIIDDGRGFRDGLNTGMGVSGYGLISMRERAELVGGTFSLESVRGAGTLVQVVLP